MIKEFVSGVALILADAGVGQWNDGATLTGTGPLIVYQDVPASPNDVTTLSGYRVQAGTVRSNNTILGLRVRSRGEPNDRVSIGDRSDAICALLDGLADTDVGGVHVAYAWWQGGGWLGRDELLRWQTYDTYYWQTNIASPHRPD